MVAMDTALPPRQRNLILGALLLLAAGAWAVLIRQATAMDGLAPGATGPTMGLAAPLFLAIWIAMMVAMMFPTAAPMVLMFAAIAAGKRQRGQPYAPTWIFVGAYLLVWSLCGVAAYGLALGAERLGAASPWLMQHGRGRAAWCSSWPGSTSSRRSRRCAWRSAARRSSSSSGPGATAARGPSGWAWHTAATASAAAGSSS